MKPHVAGGERVPLEGTESTEPRMLKAQVCLYVAKCK